MYTLLFPEEVIPGEDCLNLNVWTPEVGAGGLPVLVWIHGGSFMNGSGSVGEYDGSAFARDGVVCVTINYRLAAEGFLFLGDDVANLGLLDQLAALAWVQANIAAFGGDPGRVTVAGESAGAMSVTTLLAMPLSAGLFRQAIVQSGAAAHSLTREVALTVGGFLAESLGVPADRESIAAVPLERLVRAASDLVTEVQTNPDPAKWGALVLSQLPFAPVVDGSVLPDEPLALIRAGQGGGGPVLIGTDRDEARLFLVAPGVIGAVDETMLAGGAAGYGLAGDGLAVYRANQPQASPGDLLAAVGSDWFFRVPAIRVAEARAGAPAATWMYRFDWPAPADNNGFGACHAGEIPYGFGTTGRQGLPPQIWPSPSPAVADAAHRVWLDFITNGNPGWAPYDLASRTTGLLTETVSAAADPAGDERALWEGIR